MGKPARLFFFDIEATSLRADYGYVLCVSWKEWGKKKVHTTSLLDFPRFGKGDVTNDRDVIKTAIKELNEADMLCTWYGKKFDVPYLNTRALEHKSRFLDPTLPHIDGWAIARWKLKLSNNRLANVTDFLGLDDKTPLTKRVWRKGAAGHVPSIKYIIKHCEQDVLVLEQVYERLRGLDPNHPNVNLATGRKRACPVCGGRLKSHGWRYAKTRKYKRYYCLTCGHWCKGAGIPVDGVVIR